MLAMLGCTVQKSPETKTEIGFGTPYLWSPEYINGMVKSVEQRAYWATEKDGEYIRGDLITLKERDSIGWSHDFIVHFDSSGLAGKVEYLDDEGQAYGYWEINIEDGKYVKAVWEEGDSSSDYWIYSYNDAGHMVKGERFRIGVDTLLNGANIETNENGHLTKVQWFDSKGEAGNTVTLEYNDMDLVTYRETRNNEGNVISWSRGVYDENGLATSGEAMLRDSTMLTVEVKYPRTVSWLAWT
jgi:hypothetical protein